MAIGTLVQPIAFVSGGGLSGLAKESEQLLQELELQFSLNEGAPRASFRLVGNPKGFAYIQALQQAIGEPISVTVGYPNSTGRLTANYLFAGLGLTTGKKPSIEITCISPIKGAFTDVPLNFTMEKEVSLYDYVNLVIKKLGAGGKGLKFVWVGEAEKVAKQKKIKGNVIGVTAMKTITRACRSAGINVQVGDTVLDGTIVLSVSPDAESKKEDTPVAGSTIAQPAARKAFLIGPGIAANIKRQQGFLTSLDPSRASSQNSPNVANEVQGNQEMAQPQNAAPETSAGQAESPEGTTGLPNPPSDVTQIAGSPKITPADTKRSAKLSKILKTTCTLECVMVPYLVGIKPRDFIVIPSLKGPGSYLEDYEVKEVKYRQTAKGDFRLAITAHRPYIGGENLMSTQSVAALTKIASELQSPEAWADFYWNAGSGPPSMASPIGSTPTGGASAAAGAFSIGKAAAAGVGAIANSGGDASAGAFSIGQAAAGGF